VFCTLLPGAQFTPFSQAANLLTKFGYVCKSLMANSKTQTNVPESKPAHTGAGQFVEKPLWKKVFFALFISLACLAVYSGYNMGFHSDEMDMAAYGKSNWKHITSSQSTVNQPIWLENGKQVPDVIKTYGGFFEFINNGITSLAVPFFGGEYNTRHLLCQLMGMLCILFAALISAKLSGRYLVGILCMLLLYLSPTFFGHLMFNTKDIPFALGYTMCIYGLILFAQQGKVINFTPYVLITLGLAACVGTRAGGIILLVYVLLAVALRLLENRKHPVPTKVHREQLLFLALTLVAGLALAIMPWPFVAGAPFENFRLALEVAVKFPQRIPVYFNGELTDSLALPSNYLSQWMWITIPAFIIISFGLSFILLIINLKKNVSKYYIFILLTVLLPIIYTLVSKPPLYSAWRHLLFIYPVLVVFSVYGLDNMYRSIKKKYAAPLVLSFSFLGMLHPIYWSVKNHPYEYLYFNEFSGGFAKNYYLYDTDYWQLSIKEAVDWLYKNEKIKGKPDVVIGSNAFSTTQHFIRYDHKDTAKVVEVNYRSKNMLDWNYMILSNLFLDPVITQNNFYPPPNTIHSIQVDGKTICAIVKDTSRVDYRAFMAVIEGRSREGDSLADLYLLKDPGSMKMLEVSASVKSERGDWSGSLKRCLTGLDYYPNSVVLKYYLGAYYAHDNQPEKAISFIEDAVSNGYQKTESVQKLLIEQYKKVGNTEAVKKLEKELSNAQKQE
jgi:hypothetical protein